MIIYHYSMYRSMLTSRLLPCIQYANHMRSNAPFQKYQVLKSFHTSPSHLSAPKKQKTPEEIFNDVTKEMMDNPPKNFEEVKKYFKKVQGEFDNLEKEGGKEKEGENNKDPKEEKNPIDFTPLLAVTLGLAVVLWFSLPSLDHEISVSEFINEYIASRRVESIEVFTPNNSKVSYAKAKILHHAGHVKINVGNLTSFDAQMDRAFTSFGYQLHERPPIKYSDSVSLGNFLTYDLLPLFLIVGAIAWLSRRATASFRKGFPGMPGMPGQNKGHKHYEKSAATKVNFNDVAGCEEAKIEIMEFVNFLKNPDHYHKLGAKIPRGAILQGPPGTGKTLLAKATAGEANVPFLSISGSEFMEMFVGVGANRVRELFKDAREQAPCIIFIDELDAIGGKRSNSAMSGGHDERAVTLNQLLVEMDGFNSNTADIVVLAGTNREDTLDPALTRPGRFDRQIFVGAPDIKGRVSIFMVHLKPIKTDLDLLPLAKKMATLTPGFTGADIANVCNEAALIAARHDCPSVTQEHFEQAIERVIGGLEKTSRVLSPEERKIVAYHEAGHALAGWFLEHANPLLKVSIIPRGKGALGYAMYLPKELHLHNSEQILDMICMTLGGRCSEQIFFEKVTTGAGDDLRKVTNWVYGMIIQYGMNSKVGNISFNLQENPYLKPYSEDTAHMIDSEARKYVQMAYDRTLALLTEHKDNVAMVAEELLKKEVLDKDDMVRMLGDRPWGEKCSYEELVAGTGGDMEDVSMPEGLKDLKESLDKQSEEKQVEKDSSM